MATATQTLDFQSRARDRLLDMVDEDDPFGHAWDDLHELRLEAANDLFQWQREHITVLDRRAEEAGITRIERFEDLVPLLFAHTVYKSYPRSFIQNGRWDRLLTWMNTLATRDPRGIDMAGVENIDDFLNRLRENGHGVLASTGTTGKNSFLDMTPEDKERKYRHLRFAFGFPGDTPCNDRHVFWPGPGEGFNGSVEIAKMVMRMWAKPGGEHYLDVGPLLLSEANETAAFSQRMADGDATPDEIAAFRAKAEVKARAGAEAMAKFTDELLAHRHEPIMVAGFWSQALQTIARARELGIPDGDFHPASRVSIGGGLKNVTLPDDYKEQVDRFFGDVKRPNGYAMTEMSLMAPRCEAGRYHIPPALIPLLLDQPGETLLNAADGVVEGRFGFIDLTWEGRWPGLISGDKVQMDFAERCPCGRRGPVILDTISRYSLTGDDQISCAGTVDSYVKGALGE